ncbi:MAG: type II toxin-antitoxin system RelE/ParE family toxin [Flavobacteriaceae bacterium]|jgi:mRNA interferase RelE/StbE|nr:type II toxin-antitoxin system RelE/ParE family toxin [Flavobacteriaceae bacterium]
MNIDYRNPFEKDLKKILDKTLRSEIKRAIRSVEDAKSKWDIPELKKLRGYKKGIFYRIKIGSYRIGITIEGDLVTFYAVMHRKDIYKNFP